VRSAQVLGSGQGAESRANGWEAHGAHVPPVAERDRRPTNEAADRVPEPAHQGKGRRRT